MGKIYKSQSKLTITANLNDDITGNSAVYVKFRKPSGATGQFTASVSDVGTGVITYDVADSNDIDEAGIWSLWGYVVFGDGSEIAGEAVNVLIYSEGN